MGEEYRTHEAGSHPQNEYQLKQPALSDGSQAAVDGKGDAHDPQGAMKGGVARVKRQGHKESGSSKEDNGPFHGK